MMTSMKVHTSISEAHLTDTTLSADELAKAIHNALHNLKHPVTGMPVTWPAPICVIVEGDGPELRSY